MNRLERLLILVPWLRSHQGVTLQEASSHFEISEEQMVQDVLMLSVTGFGQFYGEQFSVTLEDDRIFVDDTLGLDRPVKFDVAEAASLLLGLEALDALPNSDSEAISSAREKLNTVLPLQAHLAIVRDSNSDVHQVLRDALHANRKITFEYWNIGRDDKTARLVSAVKIYFVDGCVYLDAYCHTSNGWRTFDVARILNPAVSSEDSEVPPEQFLEMNLRKEIVEVDAVHASELEPFKILTKTENDSKITAEIAVFGDDLLVRRIIASGGRLRVNPELTAKVREKALAGLTAYLDK